MDKHTNELMDIKLNTLKKALLANNMDVEIVNDKVEAIKVLKDSIKDKATVSVGGSQTLFETGIIDELRKMDINFLDRYQEGLNREAIEQIYRDTFSADYLIASSNAISMQGELFNIDGNGNRVAAMIYGPKQVILFIGINKVCADEQAAITYIKEVAAPANNLRLNKDNPCTKVGKCTDCKSENRICASYVKLAHQMKKGRIKIVLIKEEYGY